MNTPVDALVQRPASLSISIVSYNPDVPELRSTLQSLGASVAVAREGGRLGKAELLMVDNGPLPQCKSVLETMLGDLPGRECFDDIHLISGHGNIGFGAGHNLASRQVSGDFYLVLNPDVTMDEQAVSEALDFMHEHTDIGLISPYVTDPEGRMQYLCKRYPTILDLALRGFAPAFIRRLFRKRLAYYEMRDRCTGEAPVMDVPIASGCFMFLRSTAWREVHGFSDEYFMYFEDFDLCLRLAKVARLAYVPAVRIRHAGGDAAKKGWQHISMFLHSAWTFFGTHGWRFW